jgi:TP53 regulating kinase-like protein
MTKTQILCQGAEALLTLDASNQIVKKHRISKGYRLQLIDKKLRSRRTRSEAKLLEKSSKLIPIPRIIKIDEKEQTIELEYIQGKKLSEHLDSLPNSIEICKTIGKQIALLHNKDIIHGDLTTSNMILADAQVKSSLNPSKQPSASHSDLSNNKLYFIDFGLSFTSQKIEDKAVDLHLIKQALEAKHFNHYKEFFDAILQGYTSASVNSKEILERLRKVEQRGRYKDKY